MPKQMQLDFDTVARAKLKEIEGKLKYLYDKQVRLAEEQSVLRMQKVNLESLLPGGTCGRVAPQGKIPKTPPPVRQEKKVEEENETYGDARDKVIAAMKTSSMVSKTRVLVKKTGLCATYTSTVLTALCMDGMIKKEGVGFYRLIKGVKPSKVAKSLSVTAYVRHVRYDR